MTNVWSRSVSGDAGVTDIGNTNTRLTHTGHGARVDNIIGQTQADATKLREESTHEKMAFQTDIFTINNVCA